MKLTYKHTLYACYTGYITQAVVNNLTPLLFLTFQKEFAVSLDKIGLLVAINFCTQIAVDFITGRFADRLGYRLTAIIAHAASVAGLVLLGILPYVLPNAYAGIIIAVIFMAIGGGIIEVLVSPIVQALPSENKASAMNLLHSFYCWGQTAVILLSTLYFSTAGIAFWRYLPMLWAVIPLLNTLLFAFVPLRKLVEEGEETPLKTFCFNKLFWVFIMLMICAGASEHAMVQWSSYFAEAGLGINKTLGDLLGPCVFAVLMGSGRAYMGVKGKAIELKKALLFSGVLCCASYLLTVFSPLPVLSLAGCGLCGLSVAVMWPATFSLCAEYFPKAGTGLFALMAVAGDIGCASGPSIVGWVSNFIEQNGASSAFILFRRLGVTQAALKSGLLTAVVFPTLIIAAMLCLLRRRNAKSL